MDNFGLRLRKVLESKGINQQDLAIMAETTGATISRYVNENRAPNAELLGKIALALGVSVDFLLGQPSQKAIRIPVLGKIPAGIPMEAIEDILDYEEVPMEWGKGGREYFALKIQGDSMSPDYLDGDIVIFLKDERCLSGNECAIIVNGCDATFKKIVKQPQGIVLQPLNVASNEPVFYSNEDIEQLPVRVIGVAKELRRRK